MFLASFPPATGKSLCTTLWVWRFGTPKEKYRKNMFLYKELQRECAGANHEHEEATPRRHILKPVTWNVLNSKTGFAKQNRLKFRFGVQSAPGHHRAVGFPHHPAKSIGISVQIWAVGENRGRNMTIIFHGSCSDQLLVTSVTILTRTSTSIPESLTSALTLTWISASTSTSTSMSTMLMSTWK